MKKIVCMAAFLFAHSFAECPVTPSVEGPVSHYGRLQVREGTPFIDGVKEGREDIRLVQVRGVSFGWARDNWESVHFYNANAVERLVKDWKVEILRAAYGQTNSLTSQAAIDNLERVRTVINAAIENDVYIIIDWHSHNAHLEAEKERAKQFFEEMAQEYGSCDGVIFELFNEPVCANGASSCMPADRTTWPQIKEYAEEVIPIIRAHSPNLILVGTPDWSQKVQDAIGNAIDDANVGYVVHFYSASHDLNLNANINRNHINRALDDALPVFVTE
ncbi:MAG: glycoside hydrolase family 5 protein, partial [Fibromonadaceae bacterium]|nr:glycoside hydrolase family 5 protein [Fibromonadaceae bacterium]